MTFEITQNTRDALDQVSIEPKMVFVIDGISTIFGVSEIQKYVRIGDTDLEIGNDWKIGGFNLVEDQAPYIMIGSGGTGGTTTSINQSLYPDKGTGNSVPSINIQLLDKRGEVSEALTPGVNIPDVLGAKARVLIGFENTAYPEDYITIMRGIISDVVFSPGTVTITIDHPDTKKRQQIFKKASTALTAAIDSSQSTIPVTNTALFLQKITGPDGAYDDAFYSYIKIDDEIIRYETKDATNFYSCSRGQLNTVAAGHDDESDVESFYRLDELIIPVALKVMLSGWNDYFAKGISFDKVADIDAETYVDNAIFINNIDIEKEYGVVVGDFVSASGTEGGVNDFTLKTIEGISKTNDGSYIVVSDVSLTATTSPSGVIAFRSKYDTLPDGLKMTPYDVSVSEHELFGSSFLGTFQYDFYLRDTVDGKQFLEQEVYLPAAAYAIPRGAQSSLGLTIPPLPTTKVPIIDKFSIKNPSKINIRRAISKNFYNTISYKMDQQPISGDFKTFVFDVNAESVERVGVGIKQLTIASTGMRTANSGQSLASQASARKLNRYKFGAEHIENLELIFRKGFEIEIGDKVSLDTTDLYIYNLNEGDRSAFQRLFEVTNKSIDLKTGQVKITIMDTNFNGAYRYGLISPSSIIKSVVSNSQFVITSSFSQKYGANEYRKWEDYNNPSVVIRNADSSVVSDPVVLSSLSGNTVFLASACSITPMADYIMEFPKQSFQTEQQKVVYVSMRDSDFADGKLQFRMI